MVSNGDDSSKIKRESNLQVTSSKRRSGVLKKASEPCTSTGSEASPAKKASSHGHTNVRDVTNRFQNYPGRNVKNSPDENPEVLRERLAELMRDERLIKAQRALRREILKIRDEMEEEKKSITQSVIENLCHGLL